MNPYITHPLVSSAEYLILLGVLTLANGYLKIEAVPAWLVVVVLPAIVVSAFYYGREAGQREHDLKHTVPPHGAVSAFLGGEFMVLWTVDNLLQWLAAAGATSLLAVGMILLHYLG